MSNQFTALAHTKWPGLNLFAIQIRKLKPLSQIKLAHWKGVLLAPFLNPAWLNIQVISSGQKIRFEGDSNLLGIAGFGYGRKK